MSHLRPVFTNRTFSANHGVLKTPNFAMTSRDIILSPDDPQPEEDTRRWSVHVFLPDEFDRRLYLNQQQNGCPIKTPTLAEDPRMESRWPPDIFFDAVYASMILKNFAAPEYSQISRVWVERG